tara:strand:+ start:1103 stop:4885 length:3783 start_codon:yes stop_codon:yes gene_type:complete
MTDNIKKLKEMLLKHLEEKNNEVRQVDSLILGAKQNKAADTIKSAIKSLALKKKEGKSLAATIISKNYRKKMAIDEKYKSLGDYMCTGLGVKANYRIKILEELRLRGTPNVIKNLYLYYCKFGAKSLGYEKGVLVKKILNSIFVNTGFKSTNFTTIHFKLCKFLKGVYADEYMNILDRKTNLRSEKKKGNYDTMEFENTKLENCLFEECDFFGVKFINLNVGSLIQPNQVHGFDRSLGATRFYKCNFKFNTQFRYPNNTISPRLGLVDTKYNMKFSCVDEIVGRASRNKDVLNIKRIDVINSPYLIYEDCKFDDFMFSAPANTKTNPTLFINCQLKQSTTKIHNNSGFVGIDLYEVKFVNCKLENIHFSSTHFSKSMFENCELINCKFENCMLAGRCCIIKNSKLIQTDFVKCYFTRPSHSEFNLLITNDCKLNDVKFIYCNLLNFVFNYESAFGDNTILDMRNCHFICNDLLGTNFDYCNLERGDFAARVNCIEQINWLGRGFALTDPSCIISKDPKKIDMKEINVNVGDLLHNKFVNDSYTRESLRLGNGHKDVYELKHRDYINTGFTNAEEFIKSKNIRAWDYITTHDNRILYFIPPTSFNEANLKTCRFQGLDGFESFDFTKIAKDSSGRPTLNAANFTNVDLTNADMTNCNLIGTVFQVAKITGVNFRNSVTNENTDFENTIDIGLALNTDHINFGELQNNANETHSRAQFIINNREKYKAFYNLCTNEKNINDSMYHPAIEMYTQFIEEIKTKGDLPSNLKKNVKLTFDKFIIIIITQKIQYSKEQLRKLKIDFESIITDDFINILTSQKNPLQNGTPGKWCWLELVLDSLLFLFDCPASYIYNFFEFYFYDIFNAHGAGGRSCTLGMVERFVTIHSQVAEKFIMTMDVEPTPSIVDTLKHYNEGNVDAVDDEITRDYIIGFNDPSKLTPPNSCKGRLHKFALNKFLNLLKPNSTLPEEAEEDYGFNFDYTIKSEWREEFQEAAKVEVNKSKVVNLDQLCEFFVIWMSEKILKENGYSTTIVNEIAKKGGKRGENFDKKEKELENFLEKEEIPNLKLAIIMMTSEEVTHDELIEYFEGGGKRRKRTAKKARGLSQNVKSFSLSKTKSMSSRKIKSAPAKLSLSKLDKLDRVIVQKFVKLPKEKLSKIFTEVCEPAVKFFPKKMSIEDQEYRNILENKVKTMKINNLLLIEDNKAIDKYEKNMKKQFSNVSKSPKKTGSPRKSITITSRRNRKVRHSSKRSSLRTITVSKKRSSK